MNIVPLFRRIIIVATGSVSRSDHPGEQSYLLLLLF